MPFMMSLLSSSATEDCDVTLTTLKGHHCYIHEMPGGCVLCITSMLGITNSCAGVFQGVVNVASLSLAIGYPTVASIPHVIINGFKNLLAVAAVTDIEFKEAEQVRGVAQVLEKGNSRVNPVFVGSDLGHCS